MVAIVPGDGLGLINSSLETIGDHGVVDVRLLGQRNSHAAHKEFKLDFAPAGPEPIRPRSEPAAITCPMPCDVCRNFRLTKFAESAGDAWLP